MVSSSGGARIASAQRYLGTLYYNGEGVERDLKQTVYWYRKAAEQGFEEGIEHFAGCAVVISHDRWFLDRICTHILAFEGDGQTRFFEGSFSDYEEDKIKRLGKEPQKFKYRKLVKS